MGNLINQVHERRIAITQCLQLFKLMLLLLWITSELLCASTKICHVENQAIALKYAKLPVQLMTQSKLIIYGKLYRRPLCFLSTL